MKILNNIPRRTLLLVCCVIAVVVRDVSGQCGDPGHPANSDRQVPSYAVGAIATFVCHNGYEMSNGEVVASLECQSFSSSIDRWNTSEPSCQKISCGDPGDMVNTTKSGTYNYLDEVTYQCVYGYRMGSNSNWSKKKVVKCQADKTWNPQPEGCQRIQCVEPEQIPFANRTSAAVGPYWLDSELTYECLFGYRPKNPAHLRLTCGEDGKWAGTWPICLKIRCGDPGMVANAGRIVTGNGAGTVLIYSCNKGYIHEPGSGPLNRTCQLDSRWTGSGQPNCIGIYCGPPARTVANATFEAFDPNTNSPVSTPTHRFPETLKYKCDPGYRANYTLGIDEITCTYDGKWDFGPFTCDRVRCIETKMSENTEINNNYYYYGDVKEMQCLYGYELANGSLSRTCQADGYFSDEPPICKKVRCPNPLKLSDHNKNVKIYPAGNEYKQIVTFECDTGYEIEGDQSLMFRRSVTCTGTKLWQPALPKCARVTCGEPDLRLNVQIESHVGNLYGDVVKYNCTEGYVSDLGDYNRTCQSNRRWSGEPLQCVEKSCIALSTFVNGQRIGSNMKYKGQISFTCNQGYKLVGRQTIRCQVDGTWSDPQPVCQRISCNRPDTIFHANWTSPKGNASTYIYQDKVTYSCLHGYYHRNTSGPLTRECTETGRWSGNSPVCDPFSCGDPGDVNGTYKLGVKFTYGEIVNYTCKTGYEAPSGRAWSIRKCDLGSSGGPYWTAAPPNCKQIQCGDPGLGSNTTRSVSSLSYGGTIRYHCLEGYYYPDGRFLLTCLETKNWSAPVPMCQVVPIFKQVKQPPTESSPPAEADDAQTYGYVGIGLMSFEVLAVIILDLSTIQKEINLLRRNLNIKVKRAKKNIAKFKDNVKEGFEDLKEDISNKLKSKQKMRAAGIAVMAGAAVGKGAGEPPPYDSRSDLKGEGHSEGPSPPPPYLSMGAVAMMKSKAQQARGQKTKYTYRKPTKAPPPYYSNGYNYGGGGAMSGEGAGFANPVYPINSIPLRKMGGSRSTNRSDEDPWRTPAKPGSGGGLDDGPWARPVRKPGAGSGAKRKIYMA